MRFCRGVLHTPSWPRKFLWILSLQSSEWKNLPLSAFIKGELGGLSEKKRVEMRRLDNENWSWSLSRNASGSEVNWLKLFHKCLYKPSHTWAARYWGRSLAEIAIFLPAAGHGDLPSTSGTCTWYQASPNISPVFLPPPGFLQNNQHHHETEHIEEQA